MVRAVSDRFTNVIVKGEKSQIVIPMRLIDQEVFSTSLPSEILFEIGASPESLKAKLQREGGLSVEAQVFSVIVSAHGREDLTVAISFEVAQAALGAKFLEDLGLRINSESGLLEHMRHRGSAYNHEP